MPLGVLSVTGLPGGAAVTVTKQGGSPLQASANQRLEPGRYAIEVQAPGYFPQQGSIEVRSGQTTNFRAELRERPVAPRLGVLRISVVPATATVTVTRQPGGSPTTPGSNAQLEPGRYTVEARASGYQSVQRTVEVSAGETTNFAAELVRNAAPPPNGPSAADTAAVHDFSRTFTTALATRDLAALVRRFPGASEWRAQSQLARAIENRNSVRELNTQFRQVDRIVFNGDAAQSTFSVDVSFLDVNNRRQQQQFSFDATFRKAGESWGLTGLTQARR